MQSFVKVWALTLVLGSGLLFSCSKSYRVVKSNRTEYGIASTIAADSAVIKTYLPYKLRLDSQMNAVIGHTDLALSKTSVGGESLLGNFFADASLAEAKKIDPSIDFAIPSTNGGIRNDLPNGAVTLSNVFELMPFENELLVFELKGSDVQSLLEFIARTGGQPVSGLSLIIKDSKPVEVKINDQPFDITRNYHVLTSDYIAGGGDNLNSFKQPVSRKVLGLKVRDALILYIKEKQAAGEKVSSKLDRRISHD
ncbi:5'-nucleotidase C-terminal domain-containing protein [Pedobacter hartonius]|uniref:5'-nucleotidase, C-terminal domain n=1 Tax=Pedobacter hartonius TaxID=425514 RepID=A0A1H4HEU3_9SPHI|nr:5'-nucleotidase [Pedobacter hartonius]SEB20379.1 5'-nucleotidase, C-terminal domain [Pedobacter hartonius]